MIVSSGGAIRTLPYAAAPAGASPPTSYLSYPSAYASLYSTQPAVRTVVDFLARNVAQLGIHIFRRVSDTDRERLANHQLAQILTNPNPSTTRYRLMETLLQDLGIYFNAYWLKVRTDPLQLVRLPPEQIAVEGTLLPLRYWWTPPSGSPVPFAPTEIVAFRGYDPCDPLRGLSPLETLRRVLAEEVEALRALCDGRPFLITEFGYPSTPVSAMTRRPKRTKWLRPDLHLTEAEQAENIAKEWAFWATFPDCRAPFDYQINDGIQADESYGIRRCAPDGTLTDWKPAAYTVPKEDPMPPLLANILPNTVFSKADLVAVPGRPNDYSVRFPTGADTLLSPKTTGVHELRTMDYLGNLDETCRVAGGLVYFPNVAGQRFAWPLVE